MSLTPPPGGRSRRLAFLGTPDVAAVALRALAEHDLPVAIVVSQPDRRRGRGGATSPSPVKRAALELGLPVTERVADVVEAGVDLGVVVAFGRLIRPQVLERVPMVNVHFSLLPRWRGAAPVERAILAGDEHTGVDLMVVEEALDTGAVYDRAVVDIGPDETAAELRDRLGAVGAEMLVRNLASGLPEPRPQVGEATYAAKIEPAELEIDWSVPAVEIHRLVRVGGAWTTIHGRRLKIWRTSLDPSAGPAASTGDGPIALVDVQPEGKPRSAAAAWVNGARWRPGEPLGT